MIAFPDTVTPTAAAVTARPSDAELRAVNIRFAAAPIEEILCWAEARFAPELSLSCSFGGASGMVLVDLAAKLRLRVEVFYLDTGLLFPEAYTLVERVRAKYGLEPVAYKPALTVNEQAQVYGERLWERNPDRCCEMRKVLPNRNALRGKRGWLSGIRRDQSATRAFAPFVTWDEGFNLVKINPLAQWTEDEVWAYVRDNDVPYNALHDQGYPSIGCMPCTRAVAPGESLRAGRWAGLEKTECGLHLPVLDQPSTV